MMFVVTLRLCSWWFIWIHFLSCTTIIIERTVQNNYEIPSTENQVFNLVNMSTCCLVPLGKFESMTVNFYLGSKVKQSILLLSIVLICAGLEGSEQIPADKGWGQSSPWTGHQSLIGTVQQWQPHDVPAKLTPWHKTSSHPNGWSTMN